MIEARWRIEVDDDDVTRVHGTSLDRILARSRGRAAWTEALAESRGLLDAAALWDYFPVEAIRHERVYLAGGARLGGGPLGQVIAGSEDLAVAVCTLGSAVEERIREHQREGDMLLAVLLDDISVWAVDRLRQELCRRLERDAAEAGLRVSTSLSPGESAWPVTEQRVLFSLVDARPIGVTLDRASMLMSPLKSLTLVMGRGAGPLGSEGASHCDWCAVRDRCAYRDRKD